MIVIKIIKCQDPLMWYAPYVGGYVPFVRHLPVEEKSYLSREEAGYTNIVKVSDSILVEVSESFSTFYNIAH
jgi:hypothetical protein